MKELVFYLQHFADTLKNYEDRKNVSGGYSGVIINSGSNANVNGGSGNDTIKLHLAVDILGLPLAMHVTTADKS